ncbi:MAG: hypothetical protein WC220_07140 [Pedobacter sp.]|jgi:hypothetical protein
MKKISDNDLPLSHDPDENKRMENELLQLKLKAELGVETHISDINFELQEDAGMAYAERIMNYTALTENQERIQVEGPFKLYFTLEHEWWSIYYFVLPGFEFSDS